jgi:hypothetical protein
VDWRWIVANAEEARLKLADERHFVHTPAAWLEPVANTYIALVTQAPGRADLRLKLARGIPAMVAEMRPVATQPTSRDVTTTRGVADGILAVLRTESPCADRDAAIAALTAHVTELAALNGLRDYEAIGRERYEARLARALALPWNGDQLLARASAELARTDSATAAIAAPTCAPSLECGHASIEAAVSASNQPSRTSSASTDGTRSNLDAITLPPASPGQVGAALLAGDPDVHALDLHALPTTGEAAAWFRSPPLVREVGYIVLSEAERARPQVLPERFDALLFVAHTTHARPLPIDASRMP